MKFFFYGFLFFSIIFLQPAYARWATKEDVDVSIESFNRDIYLRKNGTFEETIEMTMVATKESGKDRLVSYPLVYNAISSELKILSAKAVVEGVEYPVDLKHIEDKPLASSPRAFDQNRQILVAFPQVSTHGKIILKYKTLVKEAVIPGFFSTDFIFGKDSYWQASKIHMESELPLYIQVNDKEHVLEIKQQQRNNKYILDIALKTPIIKMPVDEPYMGSALEFLPWVSVSTVEEWPKLGAMMVGPFEAVLHQPLPELLEKIAKEAESKGNIIDKINLVSTRLAENISYMGDWRTIKGAYVPRALAEIVKSKIGDCKDFSAATVAILRRLGISAHMALVHRGLEAVQYPNDLPGVQVFNHAFVAVQEGEKTLWIDPTNFSSYAQGIYPDVSDRKALVLKPTGSVLVKTSALDPKDSSAKIREQISLGQTLSDNTTVRGQVSVSGVYAEQFTGADLKASKEAIDFGILSGVTDGSRMVQWHVNDYDLRSRTVSDLVFTFDFSEKHTKMKTSAGDAYLLASSGLISRLLSKTKDRVSDLFLSEPATLQSEILLSNTVLVGTKLSACQVDSPWFKGRREVRDAQNGIQVFSEAIIKKARITNAELQSSDYATFQNEVFSCFGDAAVVYQLIQ